MESITIYIIIFLISLSQTILGVGILVLGTPLLLLLDFKIITIINYLLPLSIFSSLLNVLFIKRFNDTNSIIKFENKNLKYFFLICIPAMFLGIKVLENFNDKINFNVLIAIVILGSLILKKLLIIQEKKNNYKKKIFTFLMGATHGLTNSGGAILLLFVSEIRKSKDEIRYDISYFYLLLAISQYIIFLTIFGSGINNVSLTINSCIIILLNVLFGNYLSKKFKLNIFRKLVSFLTFLFAISLLFKNFFSA